MTFDFLDGASSDEEEAGEEQEEQPEIDFFKPPPSAPGGKKGFKGLQLDDVSDEPDSEAVEMF
jgi:hypothetical protein